MLCSGGSDAQACPACPLSHRATRTDEAPTAPREQQIAVCSVQPCNCRSNINITCGQKMTVSVRCPNGCGIPYFDYAKCVSACATGTQIGGFCSLRDRCGSCSRCTGGCCRCSLLRPPPTLVANGNLLGAPCSAPVAIWQLQRERRSHNISRWFWLQDAMLPAACCQWPTSGPGTAQQLARCAVFLYSVIRTTARHAAGSAGWERRWKTLAQPLQFANSLSVTLPKITNSYIANSQAQDFCTRSHLQPQTRRCTSRCIVSAHPYL